MLSLNGNYAGNYMRHAVLIVHLNEFVVNDFDFS
jgi:hypothetical protein